MIRRVGCALSLVLATALPAAAQTVCSNVIPDGSLIQGRVAGLGGAISTTSFEGLGLTSGAAFAGPISLGGVTIGFQGVFAGSGALYFPLSGFALYNFNNAASANAGISMTFSGPTRAAAFQFATDFGRVTFSAWSGSTLVRSFENQLSRVDRASDACWWGFDLTSGTFDRLTIGMVPDPNSALAFGFDNLQVPTVMNTVPEPSTIGLVVVGLLGLGAAARRRRK